MPDNHRKKHSRAYKIFKSITRVIGMNIGTAVFAVLFVYMLSVGLYCLTRKHVDTYEVTSGPLSRNETYTALAIREETVVRSDVNGYVSYFAREGEKINANGAVFGISSTKTPEGEANLSPEDLSNIRKNMQSFSKSFNSNNFNSTYSFKYVLKGNILQYAGVTQQDTGTGENTNAVTFGNQSISRASADGIVLYSKDGYEGLTIDKLRVTDFDQNSYHETDLKTDKPVKVGDEVYTLITDERWSLVIPLSDKQAVKLSDRSTIRVKFLKDGMTQSGDISIIQIGGMKYARIDFTKGMIRYASERFLEVELVTNSETGLKIPFSSIVTKEFYLIPGRFLVSQDTSGNGVRDCFQLEIRDKNGTPAYQYVKPSIYAKQKTGTNEFITDETNISPDDMICYVNKSYFNEGDALVGNDNSRFIVGEVGILEGVYCINQGFAVFKRIEVSSSNEEFAIVKKGTTNGITRYDHIVRDSSKVNEEQVLY